MGASEVTSETMGCRHERLYNFDGASEVPSKARKQRRDWLCDWLCDYLSYLSLSMLLNISAILVPPKVVTLTTSSVVLEFQAANGSATHNKVEYAKEVTASVLSFESGSRVIVTGESTYQVSQKNLITGATYHFRVVPLVRIYSNYRELFYRGIPSNTTEVMIPRPGSV